MVVIHLRLLTRHIGYLHIYYDYTFVRIKVARKITHHLPMDSMPDISDASPTDQASPTPPNARAVMVGAALQRARDLTRRTRKECAEAIGVTTARVGAYESGEREPTLPELEALAGFLRVPAELILRGDAQAVEAQFLPRDDAADAMQLRTRIIGLKLMMARLSKGVSIEATAAAAGLKPRRLEELEAGERDIPLTTLETLSAYLGVTTSELLDLGVDEPPEQAQTVTALTQLPEPVRQLINDPNAEAYVNTAVQLHTLPADELEQMGQSLVRLAEII